MLHPRQSLQGQGEAAGKKVGKKAAQCGFAPTNLAATHRALMTLTIPTNPLVDSVILMEQRLRLFGRTAPRLASLALRVFGPYPLVDSILSPPHHILTSKIKHTQRQNIHIYPVCLEDLEGMVLGPLFSANEWFV